MPQPAVLRRPASTSSPTRTRRLRPARIWQHKHRSRHPAASTGVWYEVLTPCATCAPGMETPFLALPSRVISRTPFRGSSSNRPEHPDALEDPASRSPPPPTTGVTARPASAAIHVSPAVQTAVPRAHPSQCVKTTSPSYPVTPARESARRASASVTQRSVPKSESSTATAPSEPSFRSFRPLARPRLPRANALLDSPTCGRWKRFSFQPHPVPLRPDPPSPPAPAGPGARHITTPAHMACGHPSLPAPAGLPQQRRHRPPANISLNSPHGAGPRFPLRIGRPPPPVSNPTLNFLTLTPHPPW